MTIAKYSHIYSKKIGMFIGVYSHNDVNSYKYIEFKRRGYAGTKNSFPHALPEGLHWWSTPEEFAKKFTTKYSDPAVGAHTFFNETDRGYMIMQFSMGVLAYVKFVVKEKK